MTEPPSKQRDEGASEQEVDALHPSARAEHQRADRVAQRIVVGTQSAGYGKDRKEEGSRHHAADQQTNPSSALPTGLVRRLVGSIRGRLSGTGHTRLCSDIFGTDEPAGCTSRAVCSANAFSVLSCFRIMIRSPHASSWKRIPCHQQVGSCTRSRTTRRVADDGRGVTRYVMATTP